MSAMRFLAIIALTFAAVQIAAAEDKKTAAKPSTGKAIEVQDYGFGVSMPVTTSTKKKGDSNSTPSATRSAGKSGSKH